MTDREKYLEFARRWRDDEELEDEGLTALFIDEALKMQGKGHIQSKSLGDASVTYKDNALHQLAKDYLGYKKVKFV